MKIREFMQQHFRHFNARETLQAAEAWVELLDGGGEMLVSLAGGMSSGEIGVSLAEMIRRGKVSALSVTGANLEEDVFNLVGRDSYRACHNYRDLTPEQEAELYAGGMNRVTDTCIPEQVVTMVDEMLKPRWIEAAEAGVRRTPWGWIRDLVGNDALRDHYKIPREDSWVLAAHEKDIPVYVPGWEDSSLGQVFTAYCMQGLTKHEVVKSGTESYREIMEWYRAQADAGTPIGFFQIGGGIAGDSAICIVPTWIQDMKVRDTPFWAYFAQVTDATTSYGGYSGAPPREKITWGKLAADTPMFLIQSDASIVAPLVFAYVLDL